MESIMIYIFEKFILEFHGVRLEAGDIRSKKMIRLLTYLVLNRDREVPQQELINVFWEDETRNPAGALKNLMYRLRKIMSVFGDRDYICTGQSGYQWNLEIPVEVDYEKFVRDAEQIPLMEDAEQKKEACLIIVKNHGRTFCPELINESWLLPRFVMYQSLCLDTAKEMCRIYEKEEDWKELENLCSRILSDDPLEEDIYCWMIRSLVKQKKRDLASSYYEKISQKLYHELGIQDTEKLREVFREITADSREQKEVLYEFLDDTKSQPGVKGAYMCDYSVFCQFYQIESRRISRLGIAEYVLLLTVIKQSDKSSEKEIEYGMQVLHNILGERLRAGDVASRYSFCQYIVLLPACDYESGKKVAGRLRQQFLKEIGQYKLELQCDLKEITVC